MLELLGEGLTTADIAKRLFISPATVRTHVASTLQKLDAPDRKAAVEFLKHVQDPEVAHTVAFAEGTFNPVAQMANPDCFKLFSKDELDAIQWDTLDEEMARSVEYDVVPDYDTLLELMNSAKREVSGG